MSALALALFFSSALLSSAGTLPDGTWAPSCVADCFSSCVPSNPDWTSLCANQTFTSDLYGCFDNNCGAGTWRANDGYSIASNYCSNAASTQTGTATPTPTSTTTITTAVTTVTVPAVITTTYANGTVTTIAGGLVGSAASSLASLSSSASASLANATASIATALSSQISHVSVASTSVQASLSSHAASASAAAQSSANSAPIITPGPGLPITALLSSVLGLALGAILI